MRSWVSSVALCAAAGLAMHARAAEPAAAMGGALAAPAPIPGTLDYQFAHMDPAAAAPAPAIAKPAPAAPGSAGLARRVVDAAGAFDAYTREAAKMDGGFHSSSAMLAGVDHGAAYEAGQLQEGAIAYGALAALQDTLFVDAVRAAAPDARAQERMAARLMADPAEVLRLPGSHETAARVAALVGGRGAAVLDAGEHVRKASYSVQKEAWAKAPLPHVDDGLRKVKAEGALRSTLNPDDAQALMTSLVALRSGPMQSRAPADFRPTPATAQSLTLAALAVMGRAGEDRAQEIARLLVTGQGEDCLKLAKLNLYQCLAVAGPHYEDMFCLGKHALAETGQCVMSTAGWQGPLETAEPPRLIAAAEPVVAAAPLATSPPLPPPAAPAPVAASLDVPMALAELDGPERARAYAEPAAAPPPPPPAEAAPPPPPEPSLQVARADMPAYRDLAPPRRLEQDEDGYAAPRRQATDDAYDRGARGEPAYEAPAYARPAYDASAYDRDDAGAPPAPRRYARGYGDRDAYEDAGDGWRPPARRSYAPPEGREDGRYGAPYVGGPWAGRRDTGYGGGWGPGAYDDDR